MRASAVSPGGFVLILISCLFVPRAQALSPGARVRITTRAPAVSTRVGTFEAVRGDSLILHDDDPGAVSRSASLAEIARFEESQGIHGRSLAGAGIGGF